MKPGKRIIITGVPGSGKTTLCQAVIQKANQVGVKSKGLISPAVYENNQKVGIDVVDLSTNQRFRLANLREHPSNGLETQRWVFSEKVVARNNSILSNSTPCRLLVIDELGPLEFERNEGWINGIPAVDQGYYQAAIIVIRPRLISKAQERWKNVKVVEIKEPCQASDLGDKILSWILD
jgi:nucleoside-triphosphatase THEP1